MEFDKEFFGKLLEQAMENPRLRQNFDLRTSSADTSQRMLNALQPQTEYVHETTSCCDDVIKKKVLKKFHVKYYLLQKVNTVSKYLQGRGIQ